jgi:hypothetical protein
VAGNPYAISQGTLAANSNYTISFTGNNLTITPATLTVTANPQTKVYGDADPALTLMASGFKFSDTVASVLTGGLTRAAGENVAGNPYAISQGTLAANSNYTISFTGNNLTIIARSITVTVNNHIKVFGTTDPALTFSVGGSGLAVGDTQATVFSGSLTRAAGENVGMYAITQGTLVANSNYSITAFTTGQLTITPAPTTATVTVTPASVQYSDIVNFSAVLSPDSTGGQSPATSVTFKIGTQTMGTATLVASGGMLTGTLASPVQVLMAPGSYTVTAQFGGKNSNFTVTDPTTPLTVTQEDARVTYTGALVVVTQSITTYTATVTLRATVQDITAVPSDPAYDPYAGDIRNATVTFVNRDTNTVLGTVGFGTPTPIVLVNPGDSKTGTVALPVTFTIPSSGSGAITPTIGIIVGYNGAGYYTRNSSADNAVITVALPIGTGFITGGGYLVMQSPAGQYAGDIGTNENFGFNVKSKHSGTNFQGNFNSIVRQNGHVYQIKSNSIASLSVDSNVYPGHPYPTAVFLSKANLNDITDPNNSIGIQGNLSLQVTMTDAGEPGNSDSISITLWNGSALWVSSHWTGTTTVEQLLSPGNGNGNLVVHQLQVLLGTPVSGQGGGEALTPEMLQPFIAEALARWQAAGFTSEQLSTVKDINFQVADLPAGNLGWTTAAGSIILDRNAAGYGWFIDPTPADDAEFAAGVMNSPAQDHVDLLTVVTHEIGHVLGFPDDHGGGLMDEALPVGVRRVPFSSIVFPSIGSTDLQRILQAEPDRFSLSTNILAALTAGQREGFSLPSTPVVTGQKYDANPLYSQSLLLLSSAGEEVAWTAVAQATPPASAGRAFMRVLDHVFAEEARLLQQTLLDDLGLALEG